jgi:hypothetical protein
VAQLSSAALTGIKRRPGCCWYEQCVAMAEGSQRSTQVSASKNSVAQPMREVRAPDCRDGNQQPTTSGVAGKRQHTMRPA